MRASYRIQRLFCSSPIVSGEAIVATQQQYHYLVNVLRMKAGDEILIFNGKDGEWVACLVTEGRKRLRLDPLRQVRPQTDAADLLFCFAPLKVGRLDYLVQKATEMGAGTIQPVFTQYTQQLRIGESRLGANIVEAAEQCGILSVPELLPPVRFDSLLDEWEDDRHLVFCDEAAAAENPLPALGALRGRRVGLLVGPEGGFSESERGRLLAQPFVTAISLGPRILRADTAAVAALAVVQASAGDW